MLNISVWIFVTFTILTAANSYPAKNSSCNFVCGSKCEKTYGTQLNESPWIVGVFYGDNEARHFICSGSLISNEHVLVSGECAERVLIKRDKENFVTQIRMGNDINYDSITAVKRLIARIQFHKNFKKDEIFDYNIGILQMDRAVAFDNSIQPICLPQSPYVDYSGKLATAMGLYNPETAETLSRRSKLQITEIPIWPSERCSKVPDYQEKLTYNMICAGDYTENGIRRPYINNFDFGQIFIDSEHGSKELVGIYAFGSRSGTLETPIVYTRVADFVPWIQSKLINQCMCPTKNDINNDLLAKLPDMKEPAKKNSCDNECGYHENQKQLVDGVYVQPNRFPWVVGAYLILDTHTQSKRFECSGALISKKHTLFSSDCTKTAFKWWPQIEIRLGINTASTMKRAVSRFYKHEKHDKDKLDFTIAIWQLDENVPFGFNIQPICLPSSPLNNYVGKLATAAGWYDDDNVRKYYAPTSMTTFVSVSKLHQIQTPIWTNEMCAELSNYPKRIIDNNICAGEYENGARRDCMDHFEIEQLAMENEQGNMELIGIYSAGPKCGTLGIPTIFTPVVNFLPWIQNKTKQSMDVCS